MVQRLPAGLVLEKASDPRQAIPIATLCDTKALYAETGNTDRAKSRGVYKAHSTKDSATLERMSFSTARSVLRQRGH